MQTLSDLGKADHDLRAGIQVFTSLNVERVADDLRLSQLGAERGTENLPPASSASADSVESSVVNRVSEHMRSQIEALRAQQDTYRSRLAQIDLSSQSQETFAKAPSEHQFMAEKERGIDGLFEVGERVVETRRDREQFRKKNRLERVARVPSGAKLLLSASVLLVIFLIEAVLNGTFLAEGNSLGLFGGTSLAAAFAFINILVAWGSSKVLVRNILKPNVLWKLIGLLGFIAFACFALGLNLALAHYRDLSASFSDQLGVRVLEQLQSNPWNFSDLNSILLMVIGLVFSLIAFADGWQWTDPFPGYADIEMRYLRAVEQYEHRRAENIDKLEDIHRDSELAAHNALHKLDIARREQQTILNSHVTLVESFNDFQLQLERDANNLLQVYREANIKARDADEPKGFGKKYKLKKYMPEELVSIEKLDADQIEIEKARKQIGKALNAVEKAYQVAIETYPTLERNISNG